MMLRMGWIAGLLVMGVACRTQPAQQPLPNRQQASDRTGTARQTATQTGTRTGTQTGTQPGIGNGQAQAAQTGTRTATGTGSEPYRADGQPNADQSGSAARTGGAAPPQQQGVTVWQTGSRTSSELEQAAAPGAETGSEPGEVAGSGKGLSADRVQELTRTALTHVSAAMGAVEENDNRQADAALAAAASDLRRIYDAVPARELLGLLSQPGAVDDLATISSQAHQMSVYLDPEVVRNVDRAEEKTKAGDRSGAEENLATARKRLEADVATTPVENAYARVMAARAELRVGDSDRALRLLRDVPEVVDRVDVTAPMVPARFNLRAAAAAAEAGNWPEARNLVDQAAGTLEQISTAPSASNVQGKLQPMVERAKSLQRRFDQGRKPKPREMRDLARRTSQVSATL
jgi:hypothetical protein